MLSSMASDRRQQFRLGKTPLEHCALLVLRCVVKSSSSIAQVDKIHSQELFGDAAKLEKVVEHVRNAESVIVTGADHFFTKQLEAVEETMRSWAEELLQ